MNQAIQGLAAPITLCKSRIALRKSRPKREMVFDAFQEALLQEDKNLAASKARLHDAKEETQRILGELRQARAALEHDLSDKQHALSLDMACVSKAKRGGKLDKAYGRETAPIKMIVPEIVGTPREGSAGKSISDTDGRANERARQSATLKSIEKAEIVARAAKARWQSTSAFLDALQKNVAADARLTHDEMFAKIHHTEQLKQDLVKQAKLTDQKIAETSKTISVTIAKLDSLDKPLQANSHRIQIRSMRTHREGDSDEVTESLHNQMVALRAKKIDLQGKADALALTLRDLQTARADIIEDIADKDKALAIDRECAATKNSVRTNKASGFSKQGQGERHFADTASSMLRHVQAVTY